MEIRSCHGIYGRKKILEALKSTKGNPVQAGFLKAFTLAILLMNIFAPLLIDHCVVQGNISRREKRAIK